MITRSEASGMTTTRQIAIAFASFSTMILLLIGHGALAAGPVIAG